MGYKGILNVWFIEIMLVEFIDLYDVLSYY